MSYRCACIHFLWFDAGGRCVLAHSPRHRERNQIDGKRRCFVSVFFLFSCAEIIDHNRAVYRGLMAGAAKARRATRTATKTRKGRARRRTSGGRARSTLPKPGNPRRKRRCATANNNATNSLNAFFSFPFFFSLFFWYGCFPRKNKRKRTLSGCRAHRRAFVAETLVAFTFIGRIIHGYAHAFSPPVSRPQGGGRGCRVRLKPEAYVETRGGRFAGLVTLVVRKIFSQSGRDTIRIFRRCACSPPPRPPLYDNADESSTCPPILGS